MEGKRSKHDKQVQKWKGTKQALYYSFCGLKYDFKPGKSRTNLL